jgi:hypothetical protein
MKKPLLLFLSLFIIPTSIFSQSLKALDTKFGFRDAKLEAPISAFKNIRKAPTVVEGIPNTEQYFVSNQDLKIGDFKIDAIDYWFYKGQLSSIEITVSEGYSNQLGVLKVLEAAYGKGVHKIGSFGQDSYSWRGEKVEMTYDMSDKACPTGDIQIVSKKLQSLEIDEQRHQDDLKNQKIKDAAKNL